MYRVTHVAGIDGHRRFVVAGTTMPVKNNLTIYIEIYKYGFHLLSLVKCTSRYFWIFYPSFDAYSEESLKYYSGRSVQGSVSQLWTISLITEDKRHLYCSTGNL